MKKRKSISYAKWGVVFVLPFFIVFAICQLYPLLSTFYYSFFEYRRVQLTTVGPNFIGFDNYIELFSPDLTGNIGILKYFGNTMLMWFLGAVPQFIFALILAVIFTSERMKIKGTGFFKTVIYMPNLIMASAFGMLFYTIFSLGGPVNQIIQANGGEAIYFFNQEVSVKAIIAFINFLMWYGNTTILLMAGIMGIDQSLFEAASIDGAKSTQVFFRITIPLLMPIMLYVFVTALIGGLQMYDVPQIITSGTGAPSNTSMTMIMYLNTLIAKSRNFGLGGAVSVLIFIITAILSFVVFKSMVPSKPKKAKGGK